VVARFTLCGTHTAPFRGIPPTGRSITVTEVAIFTVAGGRVVRLTASFDQLGLMRQLGVVPA
jgi:predicted ester cyclase